MRIKSILIGLIMVIILASLGCSKDTTEPAKAAVLEFVEAVIEVLDAENFQYEITFTLENSGNGKAINIQGRVGLKPEGETDFIWTDWMPLDFDLTAGSTYTETYVDNEDNQEDFNLVLASDVMLEFQWETE
ncbi:MAG: hypothetical protein H8E57_07005 [Candidatus Cloacimonetes bacterium]|nr:hypothetical protein [Candidatus Cloacimonadota bacterium]